MVGFEIVIWKILIHSFLNSASPYTKKGEFYARRKNYKSFKWVLLRAA